MKKRAVALVLAAMLAFAFCSVCFADGYAFIMSAQSDSYNVSKGETFYVTFYANSISDSSGLLALDAEIVYDPSHIKLVSVQSLVPEKWGRGYFDAYPQVDKDGKKHIEYRLFFDGNTINESTGVVDDNVLGVKLCFSVETVNRTSTSVEIPTELLEGTTAPPNVGSVTGLGDSYTFQLNSGTTEQSSEDVIDPFYSIDDTISYEDVISIEEPSSEESSEEIVLSSNIVSEEFSGESTVETSEEVPTSEGESEGVLSNVASDEDLSNTSGDNSVDSENESSESKDENGGFNIIFWIVVACVIVAAVAVGVYMVKNKKDDMNPVNPG